MIPSRATTTSQMLRALGHVNRKAKIPRHQWPLAIELDYARELQDLVMAAIAPAFIPLLAEIPKLLEAAKTARRVDMRADEGEGRRARELVDRAYGEAIARIRPADVERIAEKYARMTIEHGAGQLRRQVQARFGVEMPSGNAGMRSLIEHFVAENMTLATDIIEKLCADIEKLILRTIASRLDAVSNPGSALANVRLIGAPDFSVGRRARNNRAELAAAVERTVEHGGSTAELAEELNERFGFAERRAEMIARDQVGKLTGQANAVRAQSLGVTRFTWRTVGDERVRDEHAERDGEVYEYDDPPDGELPGEPINCRCSAEPLLDDLLNEE